MENHHDDGPVYLYFEGVNSVTIDYEKGMVAVSGAVDPATILVTISKLKIMTELVSYMKDPRGTKKKKQAQELKKTQNHHKHEANDAKKIDHHDHHDSKSKSHSNSDDDDTDECHDDHSAHKSSKHKMNGPILAPHGKGYFPKPRAEFGPPRPYGLQNHWAQGMMHGRPPPGPPPVLQLPPPMQPHGYGYDYRSNMVLMSRPPPMQPQEYGYDYRSNMIPMPRPLPPPQMYPYYHRPKDPPVGNSMIHYFSDDNTSSACTIM
ncbi:formin-like protein 5 [Malus sylvestris]|uniref:formin-like protein 5 n=1 Tax=Malus sylvestris TaxID=3752 RepID=UPI0021ABE85D|nr:formin-like protein 5 [Malus sylvestris]